MAATLLKFTSTDVFNSNMIDIATGLVVYRVVTTTVGGRSRSRSGEVGGDGTLAEAGTAVPGCEAIWTGARTAAAAICEKGAGTALGGQRTPKRGFGLR